VIERVKVTVIAGALVLAPLTATGMPGALLRPGMQLIYSSNDQDQPPWTIDSVGIYHGGQAGEECARIYQRRRPGQTRSEPSILCLTNDTLFSWDSVGGFIPQRPVGPGMVMEFIRANGSKVRYEVGGTRQERVAGLKVDQVPVVLTTVTTSDSLGRAVRRLRELYAVGLATATSGEFEVPDSTAPEGWRVEQRFKLREIRTP
jgi:hypothetical protein